MKKTFKFFGIIALVFFFSTLLHAQKQKPRKPLKFELGITFGSTLGYSITESSYTDAWDGYDAFDIQESGTISPELSKPLSFGGNFSLITRKGIGVQINFDYNFDSDITGTSIYDVTHSDHYTYYGRQNSSEWDNTGTVKMMVLSLNLIYMYQSRLFCPWFSGGASYYSGDIEASSFVGYGFEDDWYDFDYWGLPVSIDESINGIGFNVGGGFDIHFTPSVAFTVEARYYILKKHELNWVTDISGEHESYIWEITYTINPTVADYVNELIDSLEFNASFPKIAAGIKFSF